MYYSVRVLRLQQPVQNSISDNANVLWNSPSLGNNNITAQLLAIPGFIKSTHFLSFEGKNTGSNSSIFSGIAHYLGWVKNSQKSVELHCLNFNQIKALIFQYKFKSIFPTKSI